MQVSNAGVNTGVDSGVESVSNLVRGRKEGGMDLAIFEGKSKVLKYENIYKV